MIDRIFLGVGTSRGRKNYSSLRVNDVIGFWRIEDLRPGERLLLRAEMKLPGKAWLEFKIDSLKKQNKLLYGLNQNLQRAQELLSISFQRYISEHLLKEILASSEPVSLSGEKKDVTVLISDIRGFTSLAENMATEELVEFLNQYFEAMIKIVLDYEGLLDKFMGDALLALFGAIYSHDDDPMRAVRAALEMQKTIEGLNARWSSKGAPEIKIGIGISTGEIIVGNIGSEQRLEFTGIGPDVNYAQRIETLTKTIPSSILINESTYLRVRDEVYATRYGPLEIRGKMKPIAVYGIEGLRE